MRKYLLISTTILAFSFSTISQALTATEPSIFAYATITNHLATSATQKKVVFMPVNLTEEQKQIFLTHPSTTNSEDNTITDAKLPPRIDLGMNGVPVLDQGMHGSCVTFATTAAIDALLGKGDYISQLCNLELGSFLENNGYLPSGWNGATGMQVYSQMLQFGIINKATQTTQSCAGVKDYPLQDPTNTGNPMPITEFLPVSESLTASIIPQEIINIWQRLGVPPYKAISANKLLMITKKALLAPSLPTKDRVEARVTIGVILPVNHCSAGACATYRATNDTWAMTHAIASDKHPQIGGHEMVITGYDDDAIATDNEGVQHKGLFILRNSWGTDVGDQGTYYMSYDFYTQWMMEMQEVVKIPSMQK